MYGLQEGIFNHLTLMVPERPIATTRSRSACTGRRSPPPASWKSALDTGSILRGEGEVECSCFAIHAPIHRLLPRAKAVFHTHMPYASALTRLEDPKLKPIGQTEAIMMRYTGYDMDYTGPATEPAKASALSN